MTIKFRLILMNFMQYFVWGAWLLTIGAYWFQNKHWSGAQFGAIFDDLLELSDGGGLKEVGRVVGKVSGPVGAGFGLGLLAGKMAGEEAAGHKSS